MSNETDISNCVYVCKQCPLDVEKFVKPDEALASQLVSEMERLRHPPVHSRFFRDNLCTAI